MLTVKSLVSWLRKRGLKVASVPRTRSTFRKLLRFRKKLSNSQDEIFVRMFSAIEAKYFGGYPNKAMVGYSIKDKMTNRPKRQRKSKNGLIESIFG